MLAVLLGAGWERGRDWDGPNLQRIKKSDHMPCRDPVGPAGPQPCHLTPVICPYLSKPTPSGSPSSPFLSSCQVSELAPIRPSSSSGIWSLVYKMK